jgi:serine/threonine protein kinase/tetratricopeptide (TPR) repeat protein
MPPDSWQMIEELFHAALACAPEQRPAFLERACGGNDRLREEIESLCASDQLGGLTEGSGLQAGIRLLERSQADPGRKIGQYLVVREIGRGGMGTVLLASRADEAFHRQVAIKVLRRGLDADDIVERFRRERQILAALDHPNITRLLDGGTTADGLPYFVMELIEGEPVDQYCDQQKMTITERLILFQRVCDAVQYAHQNLVVHRDLKPSNVLVTKEGVPRLLDFGIAKLLGPGEPLDGRTPAGVRPLTPEYASPEQVRGEAITTASDVYALGVLLYVLLTGRSPYRGQLIDEADIDRAVCDEEPERPSLAAARLQPADAGGQADATPTAIAMRRGCTQDRLSRRLRGDIDNIVLMALRKDPRRRYASVEQLSEDIRRHLVALPVIARPDSRRYRAAKFIQRHSTSVAISAAFILTLTGGVIATSWQARAARRERDVARVEQAKAARINAFLQEMIGYSGQITSGAPKRPKGHDATVVDMLDDAAGRVETELADQPAVRAEMLGTIGSTYMVLGRLAPARDYLLKAYDLNLRLHGGSGVETAAVMYGLANLAYLTGDYGAAESWFTKALPIYRQHANDEGFEIQKLPAALSDAAFVMRARARLDDAEALWREALRYGPRLPAKYRAMGIVPKTFLAQLYLDRGDVEAADGLASGALDELRALGNPFALTQVLIDVGNIRRLQGRFAEAEPLIQEGTRLYAQAQGDDHPNVSFGLARLATTYYDEGRYDLAEREARKALKIAKNVAEGSHYYAGACLTLGLILDRTGRSQEAESLLREAVAVVSARAPRHSTATAMALGGLGECLMTQKRYPEAEPLLKESYDTLHEIHVPSSPVLADALHRLVSLHHAWDQPPDAPSTSR